jgi:hypothetical protein
MSAGAVVEQFTQQAASFARLPSHEAATGLGSLAAAAGLRELRWADYLFEIDLERLMRASFPRPGEAERVRAMLEADVGVEAMGLSASRNGPEMRLRYPVAIVAGTKH